MEAEQFAFVDPGIDWAKSGTRGEIAKFPNRIFIGIFGVDQFARGKLKPAAGNRCLNEIMNRPGLDASNQPLKKSNQSAAAALSM